MTDKRTKREATPNKRSDETPAPTTFEQSLARLEEIALALEDGKLSLEDSLGWYEEGVQHLQQCHRLLQTAERRVELLVRIDAEGNAVTEPFGDEELAVEEKSEARSRRRSHPKQRRTKETPLPSPESDVDDSPGLF